MEFNAVFLLFLFAGVLLIIAGIIVLVKTTIQKVSCSISVDALIADYKIVKHNENSKYYPIYEYEVNGVKHRRTSSYQHDEKKPLLSGKTVKIFINPMNHEKIYDHGFKKFVSSGVLIVLGIAVIVLGSVFSTMG